MDSWMQIIYILCFSILLETGCCLECFVCHSKEDRVCTDPFSANRSTVDCNRVREIGLGLVAASSALGAAPAPVRPLSEPPHACFKIILGVHIVRGCGKPDICQNYTDADCATCNTDACNSSNQICPSSSSTYLAFIIFLVFISFYCTGLLFL